MESSQEYVFLKKRHVAFLRRSLSVLPPSTVNYDTSRMTVLFFALSGLDILDALGDVPQQELDEIVEWIYSLQLTSQDGYKCGGFRGGHCFNGVDAVAKSSNLQSHSQSEMTQTNHSQNIHNTLDDSNSLNSYTIPNSTKDIPDARLNESEMPKKLQKLLDTDRHGCSLNSSIGSRKRSTYDSKKAILSTDSHSSLQLTSISNCRKIISSSTGLKPVDVGQEGDLFFDSGHLTMTYTALAALVLLGDDLSRVDKAAVLNHVASLQLADGSFQSNGGGSENDLRFVYCAAAVCAMLGDMAAIDARGAALYTAGSLGYAGALGQGADQESHGGSTYCGVAALYLLGALPDKPFLLANETAPPAASLADTAVPSSPADDAIGVSSLAGAADRVANGSGVSLSCTQVDALIRWLVMRQEAVQLVNEKGEPQLGGGLQGRPNKPGDTCYTFWIGASLKLLGCGSLLSHAPLQQFVLATQDPVRGGLGKNLTSGPDGLHTYLGLSGLAVLGLQPGLNEVDPALNITDRAKAHLVTLNMHDRR